MKNEDANFLFISLGFFSFSSSNSRQLNYKLIIGFMHINVGKFHFHTAPKSHSSQYNPRYKIRIIMTLNLHLSLSKHQDTMKHSSAFIINYCVTLFSRFCLQLHQHYSAETIILTGELSFSKNSIKTRRGFAVSMDFISGRDKLTFRICIIASKW